VYFKDYKLCNCVLKYPTQKLNPLLFSNYQRGLLVKKIKVVLVLN
jgi:hypothetical protein